MATGIIFLIVDYNCSTEGDIRLVDGINDYEGRVEVCHNNEWGTVCRDDSWFGNRNAGVVACRQLGFSHIAVYTAATSFGKGTGHTWLDNLSCTGSENRLIDCAHDGFGLNNCNYHAGLICACE